MSDHKFQITAGDQLPLLSMRLWDEGRDNSLAGSTVTFVMYGPAPAVTLLTLTGTVSTEPGITVVASAATDRLTCAAHGLQSNWEVYLSSAGTLPAPLLSTVRYFTLNVTQNYFQLALESGGTAIDLTDAGSGAHTLKVFGHAQFAFSAADVATKGTYKAYFVVTTSTKQSRWPNTEQGIEVVIVGVPTP